MACKHKTTYELGILGGTLINGRGNSPAENQLILIHQGKIIAIVDAHLSKDFRCKKLIDAKDKFIIPGLFDIHGHFTMNHRTIDTTGNKFEWRVEYDRATAEWALSSLLDYGITTLRETGDFLTQGLQLKKDLEANRIKGPAMFTCGPLIESGKPFSNPCQK